MAIGREAETNESPARMIPAGARICVMGGFYEGLEVPVNQDWMVIGRGRTADVVLSDPTISRAHAAIGYEGGDFFVQDLGSTNGTRVNGAREPRTPLRDGDELQLGKLLLRFMGAA